MEIEVSNKIDKSKGRTVHRDLSWLSFNERVLQEATDKRNPLLERVKFLGIYSKNLGEFFHVRMAYHLNLVRINKSIRKRLNYSPKKLIKQIICIVNLQQIEFSRIINNEIKPELESNNIRIKNLKTISERQLLFINAYFNDTLRLHVEPLLMRGKAINPFLKDASLYLGILLEGKSKNDNDNEYGIVRIPSDILPRFVILPSDDAYNDVILLDDILRHGLPLLFPGFRITNAHSFKMTRDSELYIASDFSGSLKDAIKKSLRKRQTGTPARFVYDRDMPANLLSFLTNSFDLNKYDKIKEGRYQNYSDLLKFPNFGKFDLLNTPFDKLKYPLIEEAIDPYEVIRNEDHFIHPPYHTFDSVIQFFEFAAHDNLVTEICVTQYRIGANSRINNALISASRNGKKVTVFMEVQARFDEKENMEWGEKLEQVGVKVIYSIPGMKVHCKIGLVKREKLNTTETFAILSTGNFHEANSKIYSDMCLFTSHKEICYELYEIFKQLESPPEEPVVFKHLLVGKNNLRERLEDLIDAEISNAKKGKKAYIILKMNSLEDDGMILKLMEASKANVKIDLIIRGICCLIPDRFASDRNIRIISIVDRYLEHSRVYYFYANGADKLYLSSADWMTRNLNRRVEVAFPIYDNSIKYNIMKILNLQLCDNVKARVIDFLQDNSYKLNDKPLVQSQKSIYNYLSKLQKMDKPVAQTPV